jgi:hypothetical protein
MVSSEKRQRKTVKSDCIFFFSWNEAASALLENLKPGGMTVFVGAFPCKKPKVVSPINSSLILSSQLKYETLNDIALQKLPPPSKIIACHELASSGSMISMLIEQNSLKDTIPLLFNTEWNGNRALVFCGRRFLENGFSADVY